VTMWTDTEAQAHGL